ncbi:alpha/beta fold hydrolase [Halomonas cupida]|uniref:alpha/beta fold hydrolase n=1 Tax=Halomonas cupida TaxID=44933 RepID=UPI003A92764F
MAACSLPRAQRLAEGRLAALVWGRAQAPVWLALHGWLDNAASFTRLAPCLAEALDIQIVAIDFAGHGLSEPLPGHHDYALWDYCHDVLDTLDELGLERAPLLAHSMGAGVASLLAAAIPERVERLVLIDGLGALTTPAEELPRELGKSLRAHRRRRSSGPRYADAEAAVAARVAGGATPVRAAEVNEIVARNLRDLPDGSVALRTDPRLKRPSPVRLTPEQVVAMLAAIECRVLLIEGREGILGEREWARRSRAAVRQLERHVLDGGHHLHVSPDCVETVASTIVKASSPWGQLE